MSIKNAHPNEPHVVWPDKKKSILWKAAAGEYLRQILLTSHTLGACIFMTMKVPFSHHQYVILYDASKVVSAQTKLTAQGVPIPTQEAIEKNSN